MAISQFKLPIGAKRQVTIPQQCMDLLSLNQGSELLLEVEGDHATLTPIESVPRWELPKELRERFLARRGRKSDDIPLSEFLDRIGYEGPRELEVAVPKNDFDHQLTVGLTSLKAGDYARTQTILESLLERSDVATPEAGEPPASNPPDAIAAG